MYNNPFNVDPPKINTGYLPNIGVYPDQLKPELYSEVFKPRYEPMQNLSGLESTLIKPGENFIQYQERIRKQKEANKLNVNGIGTILPFANTALLGISNRMELNRQNNQYNQNLQDDFNPSFSQAKNDYGQDENEYLGQRTFKKGGTFQEGGEENEFDAYDFLFGNDEESNERMTESSAEEQAQKQEELKKQAQLSKRQQEADLVNGMMQESQFDNRSFAQRYPSSDREGFQGSIPQVNTNVGGNEQFAYNYYQQRGLPKHVAAGIVANLSDESNVKPLTYDDGANGKGGGGVAQWSPERFSRYKQWAVSTGRNTNDLKAQLDYILIEANQRGDLQKTMNTSNASEAATVFGKTYLRPAKKYLYSGSRQSKATNVMNKFEQGGEYDLSNQEILELSRKGYKFDII